MAPPAPVTPVISASLRLPAVGSWNARLAAATAASTAAAAASETATGHRPLLAPAWLSAMNSRANPAPAASPHPTPAHDRAAPWLRVPAGAALEDTAAIAGSANPLP